MLLLLLQTRLEELEAAAKAHAEELAAVEKRCAAAAAREKTAAAAAAAAAEKELQQTVRQLVVEQAKTRKALGQLELARQQQTAIEKTLQGSGWLLLGWLLLRCPSSESPGAGISVLP